MGKGTGCNVCTTVLILSSEKDILHSDWDFGSPYSLLLVLGRD